MRETSPLSVGLRPRPFRRNPGQSIAPELRRLGARDAVLLRHDKEGHALNAHAIALLLQIDHGLEAVGIRERALERLGVETGLGRQTLQDLGLTDVARLLEIGLKQPIDEGVLAPLPPRPPNGAVGEPRVGRALHAVEGKGDAKLLAGFDHVAVELGAARRTKFLGAVSLSLAPLRGHVGIELEGPPGQARRRGHVWAVEGGLETALAGLAPAAEYVPM